MIRVPALVSHRIFLSLFRRSCGFSPSRRYAGQMRRKQLISAGIWIVSSAHANSAQAQETLSQDIAGGIFAFFATEFGDIRSAALLNQIFGPLYPAAGGGAHATAFSVLTGFVNLAFLAVGGLLLAYNITAGLLQSAHEGEILGRRWSSLWAPLRVLFAVALLIPVPGLGGYNVIQGGVAWIVRGATLLASELWSQGSAVILSGEIPLTGAAPRLDGELFGAVYRNQLCLWLANHQFAVAGSPLRVRFKADAAADPPLIMSFVDGSRGEICGSYRLPETPAYIRRLGPSASIVESRFRNMHAEILQDIIEAADGIIARQWPVLIANEGRLPPVSDSIAAAVNGANLRLAEGSAVLFAAVSGSVNASDDARRLLMERVTGAGCGIESSGGPASCGGGWIGAGNWHMTIARFNAELTGLLNARPTAAESRYLSAGFDRLNRQVVLAADEPGWLRRVFGGTDASKYLHIGEAGRIWQAATGQFERAAVRLSASNMRISGKILRDAVPVGHSGLLERIWQIGFADAAGAVIESFSPANWADDPIVGVVRMGNWYLDVAGALIFGGAAASLLTGGFGTAVVFMVAAPLAAVGMTQSFILPVLPFLYWVLAVSGYFLLVIEAVAAVSLWAVAHMRLDGEGISGEAGRYGWLMLLGLMLTPSLMILGYFAGMILFRVTARLFDAGMFYAMSALAEASPIVAVSGLIASGFLIVFAYVVILERSFSLISVFPGRVLRWIGSEAHLADGFGENRFRSGLHSATSAFGSGVSKAGQVSVQALRSTGAGGIRQ